jgi:hypothetical protein
VFGEETCEPNREDRGSNLGVYRNITWLSMWSVIESHSEVISLSSRAECIKRASSGE